MILTGLFTGIYFTGEKKPYKTVSSIWLSLLLVPGAQLIALILHQFACQLRQINSLHIRSSLSKAAKCLLFSLHCDSLFKASTLCLILRNLVIDCSCGGCRGFLKALKTGVGRRPCHPYLCETSGQHSLMDFRMSILQQLNLQAHNLTQLIQLEHALEYKPQLLQPYHAQHQTLLLLRSMNHQRIQTSNVSAAATGTKEISSASSSLVIASRLCS